MKRLTSLFLIGFFWIQMLSGGEPQAVYLSWKEDPSSTMVIHWIDKKKEGDRTLYFMKMGNEEVYTIPVEMRTLRNGIDFKMFWTELSDLEADSEYTFWFKTGEESTLGYKFKTLPKEIDKPLRFAIGGDAYYHNELFKKMNRVVSKLNPSFVILGGDIAYAHGHKMMLSGANYDWERWLEFFRAWSKQMIDDKGHLIPLVPVVGNHDIRGNFREYQSGEKKPTLFYDLFVFKEDLVPYRTFDVGKTLTVFLLDSGHTHPVDGEQKTWLASQLEEHKNVPFKLAVYHVPAYPSIGSFERRTSTRIREHWSPLFEEGGIQAAFEHHSHTFKRTVPIKNGEEDPDGVTYLGDGSWGASLRTPYEPYEAWYINKSKSVNCAFIVDVTAKDCTIRAVDNRGRFFDDIVLRPRN